MNIAVLGAGRVGTALAARFAAVGHDVTFGRRDPGAGSPLASVGVADPPTAVRAADVVLLAVPWSAVEDTVTSAGDLTGKVVVDATNPLGGERELVLGHDRSGGEHVAALAPGAKVVKAFNTTGSGNMTEPSRYRTAPFLPVAGDDLGAKSTVIELANAIGFDAYDVGPLATARITEPFAQLWITLAYAQGLGPDFVFTLERGS
jgi:predicted dinucleotide-binding enzyme